MRLASTRQGPTSSDDAVACGDALFARNFSGGGVPPPFITIAASLAELGNRAVYPSHFRYASTRTLLRIFRWSSCLEIPFVYLFLISWKRKSGFGSFIHNSIDLVTLTLGIHPSKYIHSTQSTICLSVYLVALRALG